MFDQALGRCRKTWESSDKDPTLNFKYGLGPDL